MSLDTSLLGMSQEAFKFAKLNGTNYQEWQTHMEATLSAKYLWMTVAGYETEPPQ